MSNPEVAKEERWFYLLATEDVFNQLFKEKRMNALEWFLVTDPLRHEATPDLDPLHSDEVNSQRDFHAKVDLFFKHALGRFNRPKIIELLCRVARAHQKQWSPIPPGWQSSNLTTR